MTRWPITAARRLVGDAEPSGNVVDFRPKSVRARKPPPPPPPPPPSAIPRSPVELLEIAGLVPFAAQRANLHAAYAVPPDPEEREVWPEISACPWPDRPAQRIVACWGRRGGKDVILGAAIVVWEALFGGHEPHVLPGLRLGFGIVAPSIEQARESVRAVRMLLDRLAPMGVRYRQKDPSGSTELVLVEPATNVEKVICVMTADAATSRGFAFAVLIFTEAGHLPTDPKLSRTDRDIYRALAPSTAQFPNRKIVFISTPGAPEGIFYDATTKPRPGTLVTRGPTWRFNPRITRETCWELADGHEATFQIEYEASRFGLLNETFLDPDDVRRCVDETLSDRRRQPGGNYLVVLDLALIGDGCAVSVFSTFFTDMPGSSPVRHLVVETCELLQGSKKEPLQLGRVLDRVAGTARRYNHAVCYHDQHIASEVHRGLAERGVRSEQVEMTTQAQSPRWATLAGMVAGSRLHIPPGPNGEAMVKQLCGLKATTVSGGWLKVDGRPDDLADTVAIAAEKCAGLRPLGGEIGYEIAPVIFTGANDLIGGERRWYREYADGRRDFNVVPPVGSKEFLTLVERSAVEGWTCPAIDRWRALQAGQDPDEKSEPPPQSIAEFKRRVEAIRANRSIGP